MKLWKQARKSKHDAEEMLFISLYSKSWTKLALARAPLFIQLIGSFYWLQVVVVVEF